MDSGKFKGYPEYKQSLRIPQNQIPIRDPNPTSALQVNVAISRLKNVSQYIDETSKNLPSMQDPEVDKNAILLNFQNTLLALQKEIEGIRRTLEPVEKTSVKVDTEHFPQI